MPCSFKTWMAMVSPQIFVTLSTCCPFAAYLWYCFAVVIWCFPVFLSFIIHVSVKFSEHSFLIICTSCLIVNSSFLVVSIPDKTIIFGVNVETLLITAAFAKCFSVQRIDIKCLFFLIRHVCKNECGQIY